MQRSIRRLVATAALVVPLAATGIAAGVTSPAPVTREATQATELSAAGYDGAGVTVAVIDTGVADVPAMGGSVIKQVNISAAPSQGDQFGHGTFVAGLVHQTAPAAKIVSVKLSGADGSVDVTQVLAALQWVVANKDRYGIDVVNLSFGNDSKQPWKISPLNYAVQQAWDAGIVVVASAGNVGDAPGTVTKPADDPLIISVGASDTNGTGKISDDTIPEFVSRGPTQDGLSKPDLVAPGAHVVSVRAPGSTIDLAHPEAREGEDGFRGSGTSFAAPIVAGIAAQMLSADPTLTPDQVKYGLLNGATDLTEGALSAMGAGTVRGMQALEAAKQGQANTGVITRSVGTGSLDDARGSARVKIRATVRAHSGELVSTLVDVDGDRTALLVDPAVETQAIAEAPAVTETPVAEAPADAPVTEAPSDIASSATPTATPVLAELPLQQLQAVALPAEAVVQVADAADGVVEIAADDHVIPSLASGDTPTDALGEYDATQFKNNASWTRARWDASQWGASQWGASQWGASQWGASKWGASQWGASQWGASQWGASQWGASQWGASQWGASQWGASQWWASQWG